MTTIGQRIRKVRTDAKLKQHEFGPVIGTEASYVSKLERGYSLPGRGLLKSICARFHVNEEWLLNDQGQPYLDLDGTSKERSAYPPAIGPPTAPRLAEPGVSDRSDIDRHIVVSIHENDVTLYMDMAREILSSEDEIVKEALKSNLRAFARQVENEKKIKYLEDEVRRLTKSITRCNDPAVGA